MKKLCLILLAGLMLTGCGSKEKTDPNDTSIEVFDKMFVTVDEVALKDSYGDLVANDNAAAFVVKLTFENKGDKDQSIGNSYVQLFVDDKEFKSEMMGLGETALKLHDELKAGEKKSGDLVWGVPAKFKEDAKVKLVVNDILYTKSKEIPLDVSKLEKEITKATAKPEAKTEPGTNQDGDMQVMEMEGFTVKMGNAKVVSSDDMKAEYNKMSGLSRGYNWLVVDIEFTNGSDAEIDPAYNLTDNFEERTNMKVAYARSMGDAAINMDSPVAVGETRSGKGLFVIKDDVTQVTIDTNPVKGQNSRMNFVFDLNQ